MSCPKKYSFLFPVNNLLAILANAKLKYLRRVKIFTDMNTKQKNLDNRNSFCNSLRALRIENSLRQANVANMLGIATSTYSHWEQGRREPCIEDIIRLCEIFNVTPNDLFDF